KVRIKFDCASKSCLGLFRKYAASDHGHTEAVKGKGIVALQLYVAPRKSLGVGKTLRIRCPSARLNQNKAEGHQCFGVVGSYLDCLAVRGFGIIPTLLIGEHVAEPVKCPRIAGLQAESRAIRGFGRGKLARITRIISISDRVFKLLFHLRRIWSGRTRRSGDRL